MSTTITSALPSIQLKVNYTDIKTIAKTFITEFKDISEDIEIDIDEQIHTGKYMNILQSISNRETFHILIELDDLANFIRNYNPPEQNLYDEAKHVVSNITKNTKHYIDIFADVIDEIIPPPSKEIKSRSDVLDVILQQRKLKNLRLQQESNEQYDQLRNDMTNTEDNSNPIEPNLFPNKLTRRYDLYFKPISNGKSFSVREVKGKYVGSLITVKGIVTRCSDVKPSVLVIGYTCDACGFEIFQEVNSKFFTPLTDCTSPQCLNNQNKNKLFMSTRASKFSSFQEVKLQELSNQVPIGHIPRNLTIHVNGNHLVRSMNPGDLVDVSGIFMPSPYTGFKALKAGLLTEIYLEAQYVNQCKKQYDLMRLNNEAQVKIKELVESGDVYNKLAKSIAPEIFGHLDIKKILLLLLCGGVTKEIGDGLKIRGDINVCLMGDPGVAKSQLLKAINKIAPRSVYTTGRGSSGVGLTAAVMRDPVTDEMILEGGALVLADNGICCIDEFDKMEEGDRTAIHEVMEQQTISISKAGITTTLNARTSILAAANPLYGRYNPKLSPHENINLPAALLSRFDIMFLILDTPNREIDEKLASHVAYVHMNNAQPEMDFEAIGSNTIREYISKAREYRPIVPKEIGDYVVSSYINMRKESARNEGSIKKFSHITPRTLLSILRLSQAMARLRFDQVVRFEDVDEALRLINVSKNSLYFDQDKQIEDDSATTQIYHIIRGIARGDGNSTNFIPNLNLDMLKERVLSKGFTLQQFDDCIMEYDHIGIWQKIDNGETLMFTNNEDDDIDM
ncbi:unnamed protein product [Candida verbasci]|uniref:DNA replication licensing factor MCM7 n=1 Tax=Candida verbasci TaxID=1227364 RepID=A0A9W4TYW3_9ASCO|nr:unnamed protein product [Candida verbasci]